MKQLLKKVIPASILGSIRKFLIGEPSMMPLFIDNKLCKSYSQYQEDLIIDSFFNAKSNGSYIDIGAFDPNELSNTKKFYEKGWRGINIDPNSATIKAFEKCRPDDTNLNVGISEKEEEILFYEMNERALSTFNYSDAENSFKQTPGAKIVNQYIVKCLPLKKIFEDYNKPVDFLSIDVEGYEESVLKSNDWNTYRPTIIVIEINRNTDKLLTFLEQISYKKIFTNHTNGIFVDSLAV